MVFILNGLDNKHAIFAGRYVIFDFRRWGELFTIGVIYFLEWIRAVLAYLKRYCFVTNVYACDIFVKFNVSTDFCATSGIRLWRQLIGHLLIESLRIMSLLRAKQEQRAGRHQDLSADHLRCECCASSTQASSQVLKLAYSITSLKLPQFQEEWEFLYYTTSFLTSSRTPLCSSIDFWLRKT